MADNSGQQNMPSLWVFLIIVLGILLGVVMGTSFVMHMIQRRQRILLERRIARGEVDLEILGIKRLNVPQETIEKMPQYTFKSMGETDAPAAGAAHDFFQPTCSICLDDFVYDETNVRELPCKHIFHPECIDPFLRDNSSLCPLCKRSALPAGFCPIQVTNVMVRRERLTRRLRENQAAARRYQPPYTPTPEYNAWRSRLNRIRSPTTINSPPRAVVRDTNMSHGAAEEIIQPESARHEQDTELGPVPSSNSAVPDTAEPPPEIARRGTLARRAWRRERLASLHAREYEEQAEAAQTEDARRPLWRRVLGIV